MGKEQFIKTKRLYLAANLIVGVALLVAGILFNFFDLQIVDNNKAIIGLSFIPLGFAFGLAILLVMAKKNPQGMRPLFAAESDERVLAIRNESDAITFRILRWGLVMVFMGYTFLVPGDIFETVAWWLIFGFMFVAYMLQGILFAFSFNSKAQ